MLLIHTGEGKGKTTAALGQTLRAHASGYAVAFLQLMKKPGEAAEQTFLAELLGERFMALGVGFFLHASDYPKHREAAERALTEATLFLETRNHGGRALLVLDEALYALGAGLITREELETLADLAKARDCDLLLTGRGAPDWLVARADLVTEMRMVKHPYEQGIPARAGIDY